MFKNKLFLLISLAMLFAGCSSYRMMDFTIMSSKNFNLTKMSTFRRGTSRVTGKDSSYIIIIIPTGTPQMKEALDKAIESVPGSVGLVDGVLYSKSFYFPFIFGINSYVIEGTPLIDPSLVTEKERKSSYMISSFDAETGKQKLRYVDEKEYKRIKSYIGRRAGGKAIELGMLSNHS